MAVLKEYLTSVYQEKSASLKMRWALVKKNQLNLKMNYKDSLFCLKAIPFHEKYFLRNKTCVISLLIY